MGMMMVLRGRSEDGMTVYTKGLEGSRHSESSRGWLFQLSHSSDTWMSALAITVTSHLDSDLQNVIL